MNDMKHIAQNLDEIKKDLIDDVTLVAVTKTYSADYINEAIRWGITDIGENKVQEILEKFDKVEKVRWHLIGHLQRNKVKQIIDKVDMIHSVDSMKLANEIDKRAKEKGKVMNILVQINPANEESKFGVDFDEAEKLIDSINLECSNINICGLMCIAPFFDDPEDARPYFANMKTFFEEMKKKKNLKDFKHLSMGMSGDYKVAIEEGSNMVRIGSKIFGKRSY